MTLSSSDATTAVFNSIPGQGVLYTVVVRDPLLNTSASYVPAHTYACSFASTLDSCETLGELRPLGSSASERRVSAPTPADVHVVVISGKISTKIVFTIAGLAGLFVCFFGHHFFKCGG